MANVPISAFTVPANTVGIGATGYSLTGSASASFMDLAGTWNTSGTPTAIKLNITNTASNGASLLMDLQTTVSGVTTSRFRVGTSGDAYAFDFIGVGVSNSTLRLRNALSFISLGSSDDAIIGRRGAANLRLGAADTTGTTAPTPQFLSAQSWASSTTNNQTGANFTIDGSQGTGTGAGGSIVFRVAPAGGTANGVQNALVNAFAIRPVLTNQAFAEIGTSTIRGAIIAQGPTGSFPGIFAKLAADVESRAGAYLDATDQGAIFMGAGSSTAPDVLLRRDAPNTLALRNATAAQTFNAYGTFTDASNYTRLRFEATSTYGALRWEGLGSGASPGALFVAAPNIRFQTAGTSRWEINASGHLVAEADNAYDIGASSANRPRNVYVAGSATVGSDIYVGRYVVLQANRANFSASSSGVVQIANDASPGSGFGRLQFGGTTSSFPALKRDTTSLQARLADDSAFTNIQGKLTTETAYTAGTVVATGYLTLYDSTGTAYRVPCLV